MSAKLGSDPNSLCRAIKTREEIESGFRRHKAFKQNCQDQECDLGKKLLLLLPLELPDLRSRLAWGLRLDLQPLDDDDKAALVRQHAASLGIEVPEDVVAYLIRRSERSPARLVTLVERLRHAAFTDKRRITVPLARQVLQSG